MSQTIKKWLLWLTLILIGAIIFNVGTSYNEKHNQSVQLGAVQDIFTPFKLEGWASGWITAPEFDGKDMPDDALVSSTNIDFNVKSSIAPRQGTTLLGTQSTSTFSVQSMHTSVSINGRELLIKSYDTVLEWWNVDNNTWENLDSGYTSGKEFSFADGNNSNEFEVYTYFSNGIEPLRRFRVAFGSIASNNATTITLNSVAGLSSASQLGFNSSGGVIRINNATTSYTGISGFTLTGLTGLPTYTAKTGVVSAIETTGFSWLAGNPVAGNAIVINKQRLYIASGNTVYCSKIDNLQDFTASAPRKAGEGEAVFFPEGGNKINALGIRTDYVAVFKDNYIGSLKFQNFGADANDLPVPATISNGIKIGATSQRAVSGNGFSVYYSTDDIGIQSLTRLAQTDYDQALMTTEQIRPTLQNWKFDQGALIAFDNLVYNSARNQSSFNNEVVMYNSVYKRLTELQGINANAFTAYGDQVYYGDSLTPNVYQLNADSYNDNGLPYSTDWRTKWYNFKELSKLKELGYVYVEGFINQNTQLSFIINLDDGGSLTSKTVIISASSTTAINNPLQSFGLNPFGLINFSNITGADTNLMHFSGYINTPDLFNYKFRNIQFEGKTSGIDQNYRISKIIPFYNLLDEQYGHSYKKYQISN